MLTEAEIVDAYRYFLGRAPESPQVVADLRRRLASFEELRAEFIASDEFRSQLPGQGEAPRRHFSKPLDWPPIQVEHAISGPSLALMLDHIQKNWELLGISEPHWSVLSDDSFRASRIQDNEDHFYDTGRDVLRLLGAALARNGLEPRQFSTCFELGCGLGRLTMWLASRFARVVAMDISPSHLHLAERHARERKVENIEFRRLGSLDDLPAAGSFDLFVSIIVLQHNPPPVIAAILEGVLNRLAAGGVAYFQLSTYHRHYKFGLDDYLAGLRPEDGSIEMHVLPQAALFALVRRCGCDVLEIREDEWTGQQDSISNTLLVQKSIVPGRGGASLGPATRDAVTAPASGSGDAAPDVARIGRGIRAAGRLKAIGARLDRDGGGAAAAAEIDALMAEGDLSANLRQSAGLTLSSIGAHEAALGALRSAARDAPGLPGIWLQIAAALEALRRPVEALAVLRQGLLAEPAAAPAYRRLPVLEFQHGDPGRAVDHLAALLRHELDEPLAAVECGRALLSAGRPELAKQAFECALEAGYREPSFVAEHRALGETLARDGVPPPPHPAEATRESNEIFACISMPKTSSKSLAAVLQRTGCDGAHHAHLLGPEVRALKARLNGASQSDGDEPELVRRLKDPGSRFNVVTCVREPIARTLAHFAQYAARQKALFGCHIPLDQGTMIAWFERQLGRELSTFWFDDTFKTTFGFDFRAHPFDFDRGSIRFESDRLRLLVLRQEDPGPRKEVELGWLTRRETVRIPFLNAASAKDFAAPYAALVSSFVAPPAWLDTFYVTELARHCYKPAELEAFRSRWSGERRGHG